ncbi:N-acetylgalactosaminyltransferase 7 [Chamberlinius hualienensis]
MKIWLKRGRVVKLTLAALLLMLAIPFFLSKPKGREQQKRYDDESQTLKQGAIFKAGELGNFEPVDEEKRTGPGENGNPHVASADQQNDVSQKMMEYGINVVVSDEISMDRSIPDLRLKECRNWHYPADLPKTSVIIVFHNEGWSPLLRTVHSVINRSPPQFLEEVLLVDDFSDKDNLKAPLEDYIRRFNGKVRLVRNAKREGLIRTRSYGAQEARGEVILFLDAHCEVGPNWLPPLLSPIYQNRKLMTVPVIDGIDRDTLEYRPVYTGKTHFRGIFEWGMYYKEIEIPDQEAKKRKYHSEPYQSPTHAGGLFAMNREYFLELGGYDPGLLVWGGENFELSFKIWQCGGGILWVPCSRVGHIYRAFMPYKFGKLAEEKKGPLITLNYKRVVEVWMDEYKEYFYTREPLAKFYDAGDMSEQLALRERLQCKSFDWFMQNVAYDVFTKYPKLPPNLHWGEVRNLASGTCLDTMGKQPPYQIGVSYCHGQGTNQLFRLNANGQLGVGERCIEGDIHDGVKLVFCRLGSVDGPWKYDEKTKLLRHSNHRKCVAVNPSDNTLKLLECDEENKFMKWQFNEIRPRT